MTQGDKTVLIVVLLVVLLVGGFIWLWKNHSQVTDVDVPQVVIEVNGEIKEQFPLTDLEPGDRRQIEGALGYSVVKGGENKVMMVESPCPDKICIGMGWISHPGEAIVCLPNRVVIRVIGSDKLDLDGVSQ